MNETVETVEKVIRLTFPKEISSSKHQFLGDMLVFRGGRPFVAEMEMILKIYVNFEGPCWFEGGYLMTSGHRQII